MSAPTAADKQTLTRHTYKFVTVKQSISHGSEAPHPTDARKTRPHHICMTAKHTHQKERHQNLEKSSCHTRLRRRQRHTAAPTLSLKRPEDKLETPKTSRPPRNKGSRSFALGGREEVCLGGNITAGVKEIGAQPLSNWFPAPKEASQFSCSVSRRCGR